MQWLKTKFGEFLDKNKIFVGVVYTIVVALMTDFGSQAIQRSLNLSNMGFYLMTLISLLCFIFIVGYLERFEKLVEKSLKPIGELIENALTRIEKEVRNRNFTRFITSKDERLKMMTHYINNATKSIYIISDLSGTEETQLKEHKEYLKALDQVIDNKNVRVKRIVVPTYTSSKDTEADPAWIYELSITTTYLAHFIHLRDSDKASPKYTNSLCNVSMILIDNKYLFWKPEITHSDTAMDALLDGGLFLEDYTHEGISDFAKRFDEMYDCATPIKLDKLITKM
jgi:hypothetical protein